MHHRLVLVVCLSPFILVGSVGAGDDDPQSETKAALQALNDFIGDWKGNGAPETPLARDTWQEAVSWSWRFRKDNAWLTMKVEKGKYLKSGELRYLPDKKLYQFTAMDANNKKLVY